MITPRPALLMLEVVDLAAAGAASTESYRNIVVSQVNDHCVRLASFRVEYPWHSHPDSDELFIVVEGELGIDHATDGRCDSVHGTWSRFPPVSCTGREPSATS